MIKEIAAIELIPVIEIGYNDQHLKAPNTYPYWDHSEIWDKYHQECLLKAGFKDKMIPYLAGSSFYRISDITDRNLVKLTIDHTKDLREGKYNREQACTFSEGYVLRVKGEDKYFPQCCGELSDIHYWERLANGYSGYYEGHPQPVVTFNKSSITFDFTIDEFDEHFKPTPPETILTIDVLALKIVVDHTKEQLLVFEKRIEKINEEERLNIDNIAELLIWNNESHY